MQSRRLILAGCALLCACNIPVDIGPLERPFQPQFLTATDAIVGFPREKVDFALTYGGDPVGKLLTGDTISLYLLHDERPDIPVAQLTDTVRIVGWRVDTWRVENGSHYGEDGIATMQHRDGNGRGVLSALKPGLVSLRASGYMSGGPIPVYSCTREDCVRVAIFIY